MRTALKIAFFCGKLTPIHAATLEERPLGGMETGVIRVAEILARRGHEVTVFTNHPKPPDSNPRYLPLDHLSQFQIRGNAAFDAFIMLRDWWPAFARVSANKRFFWTGDGFEQPANFGLGDMRVSSSLDGFFAVSDWHARTIAQASGFPLAKTLVVGNGVHLPYFEGSESRARKRLIYSSTPYRGLALTVPIFKELRQRHPEAEFHVFSGMMVYEDGSSLPRPEVRQMNEIFAALKEIPGTVIHGNVLQKDLAREFMRSSILLYPNTFAETSCITVMEALAAGCAVITSAQGALPETLGEAGILVSGKPGDTRYMNQFIEAADKLLADDQLFAQVSQLARMRALAHFSWDDVAQKIEAAI